MQPPGGCRAAARWRADPLQWTRAEFEPADWPLPPARAALIDNVTTRVGGHVLCNVHLDEALAQ